MADTRKPNPKPKPAGRQSGGGGGGTAARPGQQARSRQADGKAQQGKAQQGKARAADGRGQQAKGRAAVDARGQQRKGRVVDSRGKLVKGAAARRLEAKRRRQRALTWAAVVVVAAAALVGLILWQNREDRVSPAELAAARQAAGSNGVQTLAEAGRTHIAPNQPASNWNSNPPTSGDHLATAVSGGVYDSEQDERAIVHSLEHGYVVIQYKGIPEDQVNQLREFVRERSGAKLILAPYAALPRDGVALTAWRTLEFAQRANLDVVKAFVDDYMVPGGAKSTAPEPFAP
jgi:Protein of unknown function (DUF3105)